MSARIYNLDTERGRRRPSASTPASHDALARVVLLEPDPLAPLSPPRKTRPSRLRRSLAELVTCCVVVWMVLTKEET